MQGHGDDDTSMFSAVDYPDEYNTVTCQIKCYMHICISIYIYIYLSIYRHIYCIYIWIGTLLIPLEGSLRKFHFQQQQTTHTVYLFINIYILFLF